MTPDPNIYVNGVEVLAPCTYTADNASEAISNLAQDTYEAMSKAYEAYGSGKSIMASPMQDTFMSDIAEAFED